MRISFKNWRHYLQNSKHVINVITNHNNLRYFMRTKKFNARQTRWAKKLIVFDFNIEYRKRKLNFIDALFRRSDIIKSNNSEKNNDNFLFFFCETNFAIKNINLNCKEIIEFSLSLNLQLR